MPGARAWVKLHAELRCLRYIVFSPFCVLPKLAVMAGFAYMASPWDIIPNSTPIIGHFDEVGFVLVGLITARLLVQDEPGAWLAGGTDAAALRLRWDGLVWLARLVQQWRCDALSIRLFAQRRVLRLHRQIPTAHTRLAAQLGRAAAGGSLGGALFNLLGYRLWWALRGPFARSRSDLRNLVVIGGSPRSGTTLLRSMLGRHPAIFAAPETTLFLHRISSPAEVGERLGWDPAEIEAWQRCSRSQMEFIEHCAAAAVARSGKPMWAEKTPHNVTRFGFIRRRFPHALLVHVVRDGRDVVCSLRQQPFSKVEHAPANSVEAARHCAAQWRRSVRAGLRFRGDPAYHEVRYEDLVQDPQRTLRQLLTFLGVPWDDALLEPDRAQSPTDPFEPRAAGRIYGSSIGRWRHDLSDRDRDAVSLLTAPVLHDLNYPA